MSARGLRIATIVGALLLGLTAATAFAEESLELEGMAIIGNRELPKSLIIVPWKQPELGDMVGRPVESQLNSALEPVDRDVLRREIEYFGAVHTTP